MIFSQSITLEKETELPLWNPRGDTRTVKVPAGRYRICGTDGRFKSRIEVEGQSLSFDHLTLGTSF